MNKTQHEMPAWYPHYAKDWLTSDNVMSMGYFEKGVFIQLLSIAWVNDGLPNNEAKAKQMLGLCLEEWEACAWIVRELFYDDGTKLRNKRQEVERKKYTDKVDKLRIAGSLGGKKKRASKCLANAKQKLSYTEPEPEPDIPKGIKERWSIKKAIALSVPLNLDNEEFKKAWVDWLEHLQEKKKLPKEKSIQAQFKKLSAWGSSRSVIAINHSIAGNYQGIYEPSGSCQAKPAESINDQSYDGDI